MNMRTDFKQIRDSAYFINSEGVIKNFTTGRIMKLYTTKKGYITIFLNLSGKKKPRYVHRLVCEVHLPEWDAELTVNHKNLVKDDNRVENLEMLTIEENLKHSWESGNRDSQLRKPSIRKKPIYQLKDGEIVGEFESVAAAARSIGCFASQISGILRGTGGKSAKGYTFRYKNKTDETLPSIRDGYYEVIND